MRNLGGKFVLKFSVLAAAGLGLSSCVYDVGLGYASDGYYDDAYNCDPYDGYDSYYQCDYGNGFYNIGYGGGWYDSFWYPGYGFYLFDNVGRRYPMRDHHRRYWGEKRHSWYRENRGRNHHNEKYRGQGRGYTGHATPGTIGWPEQNGGRVRDGDDSSRGRSGDQTQGRRARNRQSTGGNGDSANAVSIPNPETVQRPGRDRGRAERMRNTGRGGKRGAQGRYVTPPDQPPPEASPPSARAMPAPRRERPQNAPPARRNRTSDERVREH